MTSKQVVLVAGLFAGSIFFLGGCGTNTAANADQLDCGPVNQNYQGTTTPDIPIKLKIVDSDPQHNLGKVSLHSHTGVKITPETEVNDVKNYNLGGAAGSDAKPNL